MKSDKLLFNLGLIFVIGLVIAMYFIGYKTGSKNQRTEDRLEYVQKVDSLVLEIKTLKAESQTLEQSKDSLEKEYTKLNDQFNVITEEYDKKILIVTSFSNSELDRFFAERYSAD